MRSYIRARVVKCNAVAVSSPCVVEQTEELQYLGKHLSLLKNQRESFTQQEDFQLQTITRVEEVQEGESAQLQEAQAQAEKIIAEAEMNHAEALLALEKAKKEATTILEKARVEAEDFAKKLHEEVSQEAFQEGHTRGLAQGLEEGRVQGTSEAELIKSEAQKILGLAQKASQEEWGKVDETMLQLALKVAERILRVHIHEHPKRLLQRIRALSLLPEEREGWKLHVSLADYAWLSQSAEDINIPLLEDQTLVAGDCFLECSEGIFDARVEAQLDRCEQLLREELRHDRLAELG
ncbi:flagellar biosynthesis/type III secretory pathway protein [Desulfitobacterium dichloroeliminans LMG P-21439]|uniref:Flagellar biosynthesis/type III secretory pathway protein n=1 Tax=Desulfitobacterium dichloroeliminans (strain LMG P-21439 / DCA1) TaxID=871963 RepID=L0FAN1_DESDL|nr:FliH/SctL family protein [Desulfitobacterium dichloroeliminans]AGA70282.1 flagellar biosynthesis/type III secretory pathway protein [Desulfitobacterium dichloroeliminans LMG P-21439]